MFVTWIETVGSQFALGRSTVANDRTTPTAWHVGLAIGVFAAACGGGNRTDTATSGECDFGIGLGYSCKCVSWMNVVVLGGGTCCCGSVSCAQPVADLSAAPARADVKVGDLFTVGSAATDGVPDGCNEGGWNSRPTWSSSDPSVLAFERAEPATGLSIAVFRAVAPGTATVAAGDLVTPSGQVERVQLTECTERVTSGLSTRCTRRVPLVIRVAP